jgi:hypothetical protein
MRPLICSICTIVLFIPLLAAAEVNNKVELSREFPYNATLPGEITVTPLAARPDFQQAASVLVGGGKGHLITDGVIVLAKGNRWGVTRNVPALHPDNAIDVAAHQAYLDLKPVSKDIVEAFADRTIQTLPGVKGLSLTRSAQEVRGGVADAHGTLIRDDQIFWIVCYKQSHYGIPVDGKDGELCLHVHKDYTVRFLTSTLGVPQTVNYNKRVMGEDEAVTPALDALHAQHGLTAVEKISVVYGRNSPSEPLRLCYLLTAMQEGDFPAGLEITVPAVELPSPAWDNSKKIPMKFTQPIKPISAVKQ